MTDVVDAGVAEAVEQLREATAAKKCWQCGCLHQTLTAIERAHSGRAMPLPLAGAVTEARGRLTTTRYDCIGCDPCFPAVAVNALNSRPGEVPVDLATCPTDQVEERSGWPPLPGSYVVKRYTAPVAICTLTDQGLTDALAKAAGPEVAVVGTCQTENLGIERVITNTISNPNIRTLVLCGPDTRQAVGHLPGQSLLALARDGLDGAGRIVGAKGKRPVLKNVSPEAVAYFRRFVEVVDLVGVSEPAAILAAAQEAARRRSEPGPAFAPDRVIQPIPGSIPDRMVPDDAGYFVVDLDRSKRQLRLEHYTTAGVLDAVVTGAHAAELYCPVIERKLVSRLDHAAYLGKELARAEQALVRGEPFIQDAAPERVLSQLESAPSAAAQAEPGVVRPGSVPVKLLAALVSVLALAVAAVSIARRETPTIAATGVAPAASASLVGVEAFMRGVDGLPRVVLVAGVVRRVSSGGFELVDAAGCSDCATGCQPLVLPVRWSGSPPGVGDAVQVRGGAVERDGRLVFEATAVQASQRGVL